MIDVPPPTAPGSRRGGGRVVAAAAAIIVLALVAIGIYAWLALGASAMTVHGYIALALGIVGTAGLGIGLMVLVFYSNRYGYDEGVGGNEKPPER
jgi:hypothetical protein